MEEDTAQASDINQELLEASENGDVATVERCLASGADPHFMTGYSALHHAAENGHTSCVQLLLQAGADVKARAGMNYTPLILAVRNGHVQTTEALLEGGSSIDAADYDGDTALLWAAKSGGVDKFETYRTPQVQCALRRDNTAIVKLLIEAGANINVKNNDGYTALFWASEVGNADAVKALLDAGANISAKVSDGCTALMYASEGDNADTVRALIEAGANIDDKANDGRTALMFASLKGKAVAVKALLESGADINAKTSDGCTALICASKGGNAEALKALLESGADINAVTNKRNSSLHYASGYGHLEVVKMLVESGANKTSLNNVNCTPLQVAALSDNNEAVDYLVKELGLEDKEKDGERIAASVLEEWKAEAHRSQSQSKPKERFLNPEDDDEQILWEAVMYGDVASYKRSLALGADPHITWEQDDGSHLPLLIVAAMHGRTEIVRLLMAAGIAPECPGELHEIALHCAASEGHSRIISLLQDANVNLDATDREGNTALHWAAKDGHATCIQQLTLSGANVNAQNNDGEMPLHFAAFRSQVRAIEKLTEAGADINARNVHGATPLHLSVLFVGDYRSAVKKLIDAGADRHILDEHHLTPIDYADSRGSLYMDILAENGSYVPKNYNKDTRSYVFEIDKEHKNKRKKPYHSYSDVNICWEMIEEDLAKIKEQIKAADKEAVTAVRKYFDGHLQDEDGLTVLHWAAKLGHATLVQDLIEKNGMYPFVKTYKGEAPADLAQQHGHTDVKELLDNISSPKVEGTMEALYGELMTLIMTSDDAVRASELLWAGAPLARVGSFETDALVVAVDWRRSRITNLLLAVGVPLTATNGGVCILNKSLRNKDIQGRFKANILRVHLHRLRHEYEKVKDHEGLCAGMEQVLKMLTPGKGISKLSGVQWPSVDTDKLSKLLTEATRRNCPLTCSLLYEAGGKTFLGHGDANPVVTAIQNQHWEMLRELIRNMGASPYASDSKGDFPLLQMPLQLQQEIEEITYEKERRKLGIYYERQKDELEKQMARNVMDLQADLFSCYCSHRDEGSQMTLGPTQGLSDTNIMISPELRTASLFIALKRGLPQLIFLMVQAGGIDVDTVLDSTTCTTSLHHAASLGKGVCAVVLLGLGADPSRPDHYGQSAVHLAAMFGHKDAYQCLLQYNKHKNYVCRAGTTPDIVSTGFGRYISLYEKCGQRSIENEEINLCAHSVQATDKLLDCIDWEQLPKEADRIRIDFTKGEAKVVKESVLTELRIICDKIQEVDNIYKGELKLGGSSSDGTKLYAPDEIDVNLVLDTNFVDSIEVADQEDRELFNSGHTKVFVINSESPYLEGNNLLTKFYDLIQKYLEDHRLVDERLSLVPPGIIMTQVGAALHLAWQGKEYPLLLIGVDLVPVIEVPWIEELPRPFLAPSDKCTFRISNTSDGFWRGSFAGIEAAILEHLNPEEKRVYLLCKILLSCMKPEPWMSSNKKSLYTWWGDREWKISMPSTFALKNAYFRCLERKRKSDIEWSQENLLQWVFQVFGEMCQDFSPKPKDVRYTNPKQIKPYFAEEFQKSKIGAGAPDIVLYIGLMLLNKEMRKGRECKRVRESERLRE